MIGRRIARVRRRMKLNQSQLALLVGVSRQAVSEWEKGAEPKASHLRKIARVTKTPLAELVGA
jgi:transcriptional regulator with XRE-family HTH domain